MARARLLKPGFFQNEELAELPPYARLLFAGLWTIADRKGRMDDRPKRIKAELFPYEAKVNVLDLLDKLEAKGFIKRYSVERAHFIQIVNFEKHQSPHVKEPASTIPAPDLPDASTSSDAPSSGTSPAEAVAVTETETVAVAETKAENARAFEPNLEPFFPDEPGFVGEFTRNWERLHGRHPSSSNVADAAQLEREYGYDACMLAFQDTAWDKPPSWVKHKLEQRRKDALAQENADPVVATAPRKSLRFDS